MMKYFVDGSISVLNVLVSEAVETILANIHNLPKRTFQIGVENGINNQLDFTLKL